MTLEIRHLTKKFGREILFQDLSFVFPDRGIVIADGESGAGKTTLLRLLCGLDRDYTGEIVRDATFSVCFQEHRLFPTLTALQNVAIVAPETESAGAPQAAREMLGRLAFAEEDMQKYPAQLSGGMKQRVALARAFLYGSDVLLLDEPTKELDAARTQAVAELIRERAARSLVILCTHDPLTKQLLPGTTLPLSAYKP